MDGRWPKGRVSAMLIFVVVEKNSIGSIYELGRLFLPFTAFVISKMVIVTVIMA